MPPCVCTVQITHSGIFVCNASNIAGHDAKSYEVVVYEPPAITDSEDLVSVSVNRGDRFNLECFVTGTPQPDIVWLKNRRPLSKYFDKWVYHRKFFSLKMSDRRGLSSNQTALDV